MKLEIIGDDSGAATHPVVVYDGGNRIAHFRYRSDAEMFVRVKERRARLGIILKNISPQARAEVDKALDDFEQGIGPSLEQVEQAFDIDPRPTVGSGGAGGSCDSAEDAARGFSGAPLSPVGMSSQEYAEAIGSQLEELPVAEDVKPDVVLGGETQSFVWNNRMVKVEDGLLWLSAKGRWDDFETADTGLPFGDEAMALHAGVPVLSAERVDDRNLRLTNGVLIDHKGKSNYRDFVVGADVEFGK